MSPAIALFSLTLFFGILAVAVRLALILLFDRRHWYTHFLGDSSRGAFKEVVASAERSDSKAVAALLAALRTATAIFLLLFCAVVLRILYVNLG